jgi:hypothetical protein
VIASKPALQLGMRIISPIGSDPLGVRRIDGQLNARLPPIEDRSDDIRRKIADAVN